MENAAESSHSLKVVQLNLNSQPHIDYDKCVICQGRKKQPPVTPKEDGYTSFCRDIAAFIECESDSVPKHILLAFENQSHFNELLTKNKGVYHKQCRNEYNTQKLNRLKVKLKKRSDARNMNSSRQPDETSNLQMPSDSHNLSCYFCKIVDSESELVTVCSQEDFWKIKNQSEINMSHVMVEELMNISTKSQIKYHKKCFDKYLKPTNIVPITETQQQNFQKAYDIVVNEIIQQIESSRTSSEQDFYQLSQLAKAMSERLVGMGFEKPYIHTTRLKDQLLQSIPGLRAEKVGRELLLFFDHNVKLLVSNAIESDMNNDQNVLAKATNIIRLTFLNDNETVFTGSLNKDFCPEKTVSKTLVTFLASLMDGGGANSSAATLKIAENIAQIIQFNSVKSRKGGGSYVRHNIQREQPLPIYIGLLVHSLSCQKQLVDELFEIGLSISYSRVLDIERVLAAKACETYVQENCVCPPNLGLGVFTTAAIDNIDHNPQSTSANYSFHGTGISLIQHHNHEHNRDHNDDLNHARLEKTDFLNKSKPCLPKNYYEIPILPPIIGEIPLSTVNWELNYSKTNPFEFVKDWLNASKFLNGESYNDLISWSAFNSRSSTDISSYKSISAMLPLIKEDINSPSVVQHTMNIIMSAIKKINPTQVPVITGDQPVYAIAKQVQWAYPDQYGEDKIVVMFGGLHIEKSFLAVIGTWLEGSGWEEALVKSGITTPGRSEGILKSAHIKRARYAHEVSLVALNILLYETFKSENDDDDSKYFEWIEKKRQESAQFQYWITVMELEAILLQFVKCLRTANIDEYILIVERMCPWYLATDHGHYGRWLPTFVKTMKQLSVTHPAVYNEFKKGHFTSRQTNKNFSCISDDHLHEQNNKMVKGSTSLLGMLNEESSLVKWMVSGPEIARLISEYKNMSSRNENLRHHEDSNWFQSRFVKHVKDLVETFRNKGPFSTTELTTIGNERKCMNSLSVNNVMVASKCGSTKYDDYVLDRLVTTRLSIHATIKQSQLNIFKIKPPKKINKDKMKLAAANVDSNVFCKLFIASEFRKGDVTEFFKHENNRHPPSISEFGNLRKLTSDDDMLKCLLNLDEKRQPIDTKNASAVMLTASVEIHATAIITNAFSIVQTHLPQNVMTVKEYSTNVFERFIHAKYGKHNLIDVVFDVNDEYSLEELTREDSTQEKYVSLIDNETKISSSKTWYTKFMNHTKTKTQFLKTLASNFIRSKPEEYKYVFGSDEHVLISKREISDPNFRLPIENINVRLLLHVEHAVRNGHQQVIISTTDCNVIVVAIYAFKYLLPDLKNLWIELVNGNERSVVSIHELYDRHKNISDVLPFFDSFTGSPTTSAFFSIGKKTAWNAWNNFEKVSPAMLQLVKDRTPKLCYEAMNILEMFTILMYDPSGKITKLHECRRILFTKEKPRPIDRIPPTRDTLEQHVKRSLLQANILTQCIQQNIAKLEPSDWGWTKDSSSKYAPVWTTIPIVAEHCKELIRCNCKKCTLRCHCVQNRLNCTMLCNCEGNCNSRQLIESQLKTRALEF